MNTIDHIALILAPSLRDKFDFSQDKQFKDWADISYKAAAEFVAKQAATTPVLPETVTTGHLPVGQLEGKEAKKK